MTNTTLNATKIKDLYLAFWNLDVRDQPTVEAVRESLVANRLEPARAQDIPASTAMRRAADLLKSKTIEARTWTCQKTDRTRTQIDELVEHDGQLKRVFVGQYELDEHDCPRHVAGAEQALFLPAFEEAAGHYTGADLSRVIKSILDKDGLGAYSPRKGGAVYFVPIKPEAADLLERITRFAASVQVNFLTYEVDDTAGQRTEIASAIANTYQAEIDTHTKAINDYNLETKPGIVDNRREALKSTGSAMARLQGLMNGRYEAFRDTLATLEAKLLKIDTDRAANEAAVSHQQRTGGRRRIVASNVA
jgi:hypothetical protein